jgi:hypothetical protein
MGSAVAVVVAAVVGFERLPFLCTRKSARATTNTGVSQNRDIGQSLA